MKRKHFKEMLPQRAALYLCMQSVSGSTLTRTTSRPWNVSKFPRQQRNQNHFQIEMVFFFFKFHYRCFNDYMTISKETRRWIKNTKHVNASLLFTDFTCVLGQITCEPKHDVIFKATCTDGSRPDPALQICYLKKWWLRSKPGLTFDWRYWLTLWGF